MRWKVHGRRTMYESDWVNVYLDDVELPDGTHIDHHVLTMPKASQTAIVLNDARDQILLIWRHRFITDKWGWEVPAGWVEIGEAPEASIRREIREETGYHVERLRLVVGYDAIPGLSTMHFSVWEGLGGTSVAEPAPEETERVEWVSVKSLPSLVADGLIQDGPSLTAIGLIRLTGNLDGEPNRR